CPIGNERVGFAGLSSAQAGAAGLPGAAGLTIEGFLATVEQGEQPGPRRRQPPSPEQEPLQRRQEAYAGWLVLNPVFRTELATLQQATAPWVVEARRFPCAGEFPCGPGGEGELDQFTEFYRRWCLDRMLTWELPFPLDLVHCQVSELAGAVPLVEGVALLVPWSLLRGEQVDFQAALGRMRNRLAPDHLSDWLRGAGSAEEGPAGQITYQRLFTLYWTHHLVLQRRYGSACRGQFARLDGAIATVMGRDEDLVRKLRQRLQRELQAAE